MLVIDDKLNADSIMVVGIAIPNIDTTKICVVVSWFDVKTHNLNSKQHNRTIDRYSWYIQSFKSLTCLSLKQLMCFSSWPSKASLEAQSERSAFVLQTSPLPPESWLKTSTWFELSRMELWSWAIRLMNREWPMMEENCHCNWQANIESIVRN